MIGIVRIALKRPYTFVVLAVFILIVGVLSACRTSRRTSKAWIRVPQPLKRNKHLALMS